MSTHECAAVQLGAMQAQQLIIAASEHPETKKVASATAKAIIKKATAKPE